MESGRPLYPWDWRSTAAVALICGSLLFHLQYLCPHLIGVDTWYHLQVAREILENGAALKSFPWAFESVFADRFTDSSLLYHLFLIPLIKLVGVPAAGKIAPVIAGTIFAMVFHRLLAAHGCPIPIFFAVLLLGGGAWFTYRLTLNRGFHFSLVLMLICLSGLFEGSRLKVALCGFLFPFCYTALFLPIGLGCIHGAVARLTNRPLRSDLIFAAIAGVCVGVLLHPNFPGILEFTWIQNVQVLWLKWSLAADLSFGDELKESTGRMIVFTAPGFVVAVLGSLLALMLRGSRPRHETVTLFTLLVLFSAATLLSQRFIEYAAPLAIAFAAFLLRDLDLDPIREAVRIRSPSMSLVPLLGVLLCSLVLSGTYIQLRSALKREPPSTRTAAARWLREHVPPGTRVVTTDWDDFPELFYGAPDLRYPVALDPVFMFVRNPARYRLWREVCEGRAPDLHGPLAHVFRADYVFATPEFSNFTRRADSDPRLQRVFTSPGGLVYRVLPDQDFLRKVAVCGPLDPTREPTRDFDAWILASPAGADPPRFVDVDVSAHGSFIDLGRELDSRDHALAYVRWEGTKPEGLDTLILGSDDGVKVWIDGEAVFYHPGGEDVLLSNHQIQLPIGSTAMTILVRVLNDKGPWGLFLGFRSSSQRTTPIIGSEKGRAVIQDSP